MNPPPNCDKCGKPIKGPPFVFIPESKELLHQECAERPKKSEAEVASA